MAHSKDWVDQSLDEALAEIASLDGQLAGYRSLMERRNHLSVVVEHLRALKGEPARRVPKPARAEGSALTVSGREREQAARVLGVATETDLRPLLTAATDDAPAIWERAKLVLALAERPMGVPGIAAAIKGRWGWEGGKNMVEIVRSAILRRDDVFERVGPGMVALREWPPERKVLQRMRANSELAY